MNKETQEILIESLGCLSAQLKIQAMENNLENIEVLRRLVKVEDLKNSLETKSSTE
jgi:hypothetical protein